MTTQINIPLVIVMNSKAQPLPPMPVHVLRLVKPVGNFQKLKVYNLFFQQLKDMRIAVFEQGYHDNGYHVFKDQTEIMEYFEEAPNQLNHVNAA